MEIGGGPIASFCRAPVLLLSGYQDRPRKGAGFGFLMALAFSISALVTAIWVKLWGGVAICSVVLCSEALLTRRWWKRWTSASAHGERGSIVAFKSSNRHSRFHSKSHESIKTCNC